MVDELRRLKAEYIAREQRFGSTDTYSLFNKANLFLVQQRERDVLSLLRREGLYPLAGRRILDVGCGAGGTLLEFLSYGAVPENLYGIDLLDWRVARAERLCPRLSLVCADGQHLPFPDGYFDVVLQYTVFTSILSDEVKRHVAREIGRVVKPGGMVLWYDYWINPTNKQTKGIAAAEIKSLFSNSRFSFHRITLAPPIARRLVSLSWLACHVLERLRIFNTHYLVAIRPGTAENPTVTGL